VETENMMKLWTGGRCLDLGVYMMNANWGIDFAETFPGTTSN